MRYFDVKDCQGITVRVQASGFYFIGNLTVFYKGLLRRNVASFASPWSVVEVPAHAEALEAKAVNAE